MGCSGVCSLSSNPRSANRRPWAVVGVRSCRRQGNCVAPAGRWLAPATPPTPRPAHLSAPAAVSLTARLGSSSSGPRRRTASRRAKPGHAGRCCTSRASPAQAHSRTSALGCWSCRRGASQRRRRAQARRPRQGAPRGPGAHRETRPSRPPPHLLQQLGRGPVVLVSPGPVRLRCRFGLTVARRGELRSLEALRPALAHGDVRYGGKIESGGQQQDAAGRGAGPASAAVAAPLLSRPGRRPEPTWGRSAQARRVWAGRRGQARGARRRDVDGRGQAWTRGRGQAWTRGRSPGFLTWEGKGRSLMGLPPAGGICCC